MKLAHLWKGRTALASILLLAAACRSGGAGGDGAGGPAQTISADQTLSAGSSLEVSASQLVPGVVKTRNVVGFEGRENLILSLTEETDVEVHIQAFPDEFSIASAQLFIENQGPTRARIIENGDVGIIYSHLPAGEHAVVVGYETSFVTPAHLDRFYTAELVIDGEPIAKPFTREPPNPFREKGLAYAQPLPAGETIEIQTIPRLNEAHYFTFTIETTTQVDFGLTADGPLGLTNAGAFVYTQDEVLLKTLASFQGETETYSAELAPGAYYIVVTAGNSSETGKVTIRLDADETNLGTPAAPRTSRSVQH